MKLTLVDTLPALPHRPTDGHKGLFGRLLIVGGSEGMIGAPAFAGAAAFRMGAGLVQVAVPREILTAVLSIEPEMIGLPLLENGDEDALLQAADKADAIVIGPGLGQSPQSRRRLDLLCRLEKPMVVDADALNMLARGDRWPETFKASAVLTPHPGEMSRLGKLIGRTSVPSDDAGRMDLAAQAASAFEQVVVLKGARTVITDGQRVYVNQTGDSTLSKGGTGDILSGMLGCLLAQKLGRFDAAALAVHLHGRAGELAGQRHTSRAATAQDIIDAIGTATKEREKQP